MPLEGVLSYCIICAPPQNLTLNASSRGRQEKQLTTVRASMLYVILCSSSIGMILTHIQNEMKTKEHFQLVLS